MPTASIAYPPTAQTNHDESSQIPAVTNVQPQTGAKMVLGPDDDATKTGKAERLRGGCIPCPVCRQCVSLACVRLRFVTGRKYMLDHPMLLLLLRICRAGMDCCLDFLFIDSIVSIDGKCGCHGHCIASGRTVDIGTCS